jgi:hypothetical protein
MKEKKSSIGYIHLSKYSIHMLYTQFNQEQRLWHSLSCPFLHFSACSSLTSMGKNFWMRHFVSMFFIELKVRVIRIFTLKFPKTFWRSAAEYMFLVFDLDSNNKILCIYLKSSRSFFHLHTIKNGKSFKK